MCEVTSLMYAKQAMQFWTMSWGTNCNGNPGGSAETHAPCILSQPYDEHPPGGEGGGLVELLFSEHTRTSIPLASHQITKASTLDPEPTF